MDDADNDDGWILVVARSVRPTTTVVGSRPRSQLSLDLNNEIAVAVGSEQRDRGGWVDDADDDDDWILVVARSVRPTTTVVGKLAAVECGGRRSPLLEDLRSRWSLVAMAGDGGC